MRLPETVLTTVFEEPFSTVSYYNARMISGAAEIRYEVLYYYHHNCASSAYPRSSIAFWYSA